jgi:hypothetical protein
MTGSIFGHRLARRICERGGGTAEAIDGGIPLISRKNSAICSFLGDVSRLFAGPEIALMKSCDKFIIVCEGGSDGERKGPGSARNVHRRTGQAVEAGENNAIKAETYGFAF